MAEKPRAKVTDEPTEEVYPKYEMNGNTINITVQSGGQIIFQSGHPIPWPPKTVAEE